MIDFLSLLLKSKNTFPTRIVKFEEMSFAVRRSHRWIGGAIMQGSEARVERQGRFDPNLPSTPLP